MLVPSKALFPQIDTKLRLLKTLCAYKRKYSGKHIYRQLCHWDNTESFTQSLLENICYNNDGLVILNKPYGVGVNPPPTNARVPESFLMNTAVAGNNYYLADALPYIAGALGYKSLTVEKSPGRYASGITILSSSEEVTKNIRKSLEYTKRKNNVIYHHWALTVGTPEPESGSEKIGLALQLSPDKKEKQVVLESKYSKASVKNNKVHPVYVEYKILQKGSLASLVEINTSRTRWHFVRIYLAYLLSPALGDNLYGSRVQTVLNIPVAISPFSDQAKMPQKLSKELRDALKLQPQQELMIPTHIHSRKIILENYGDAQNISAEAPLPKYFLWSCRQLMVEPQPYSVAASVM